MEAKQDRDLPDIDNELVKDDIKQHTEEKAKEKEQGGEKGASNEAQHGSLIDLSDQKRQST